MLLRDALGGSLRHARVEQKRTLREISTIANVSLGYLSEVERGRKEASSELLAAICDALDLQVAEILDRASDALRTGSDSLASAMASAHGAQQHTDARLRIVMPYQRSGITPSVV